MAATLMRGGTSKGVFVRAEALPPEGPERDRFVLAMLGSPDPMQLDGLGGTHSSTSKLMAVAPSERDGCDVDYLFAQGAIDDAAVDWTGNCGNLTTAVGPFAVDEGLVDLDRCRARAETPDTAVVILYNSNTGVRVRAIVPLIGDRAAPEGDFAIAGVPGTGPPIAVDFLDPGGAVLGRTLPTGRPVDRVELGDGTAVEVSLVDVTSPHVFVRAEDVDLADLDHLERLRSAVGALVALSSPAIPRLVVVARPVDGLPGVAPPIADRQHPLVGPARSGGSGSGGGLAHLLGRATSMQRLHHAFPLTGALCTAAAALIEGTVPHRLARSSGDGPFRLRHPKGVIELRAEVGRPVDGDVEVSAVGVVRTARRLFRGEAFVIDGRS